MQGFKTLLFYLLGLVGLIVASVTFTGQVEVIINDPPAATPTATAILAGKHRTDCVPSAMAMSYIYIPGAPFTTTLAPPRLKGERLIVFGTVFAPDGLTPLSGALVEVWQADADGQYENLRAQMQTDAFGRYRFTTIKPGHYQVDCQILPAHIHYRASHSNYRPLFALLFFERAPYLANIPSVKAAYIRPLALQTGPDGSNLQTTFNLVLPANPARQR